MCLKEHFKNRTQCRVQALVRAPSAPTIILIICSCSSNLLKISSTVSLFSAHIDLSACCYHLSWSLFTVSHRTLKDGTALPGSLLPTAHVWVCIQDLWCCDIKDGTCACLTRLPTAAETKMEAADPPQGVLSFSPALSHLLQTCLGWGGWQDARAGRGEEN